MAREQACQDCRRVVSGVDQNAEARRQGMGIESLVPEGCCLWCARPRTKRAIAAVSVSSLVAFVRLLEQEEAEAVS